MSRGDTNLIFLLSPSSDLPVLKRIFTDHYDSVLNNINSGDCLLDIFENLSFDIICTYIVNGNGSFVVKCKSVVFISPIKVDSV